MKGNNVRRLSKMRARRLPSAKLLIPKRGRHLINLDDSA